MKSFLVLLAIIIALFQFSTNASDDSSTLDSCKDISDCPNSQMICGCSNERCKYFGGDCQMESYNKCNNECKLSFLIFLETS